MIKILICNINLQEMEHLFIKLCNDIKISSQSTEQLYDPVRMMTALLHGRTYLDWYE